MLGIMNWILVFALRMWVRSLFFHGGWIMEDLEAVDLEAMW